MKILLSIIFNSFILWFLSFLLLWDPSKEVSEWIVVTWWITTYLVWWTILWLINITIKPILKILSFPLFFVFFGLVSVVINWIVLFLLDHILNSILEIPWVSYTISWEPYSTLWWTNFIIAIAIFSILNMLYSLLFKK